MKTYQVEVLEENDNDFVLNILTALSKKDIVRFAVQKKYILEGEPMTHAEFDDMLTKALNSKSYSVEDAKQILNL